MTQPVFCTLDALPREGAQAERLVTDCTVTLKSVEMPEERLLRSLGAIADVDNFSALYTDSGDVDVCDFTLKGVGLTEREMIVRLSVLGSADCCCLYESEVEQAKRVTP